MKIVYPLQTKFAGGIKKSFENEKKKKALEMTSQLVISELSYFFCPPDPKSEKKLP